jgi:hypothetical protein
VRRFVRDNALSLFFLAIFLGALVAQAIAGHAAYNADERSHAALTHQAPQTISLARYLVSSEFGNAVLENWQSEYLQFTLFLMATVWLGQRGSTQSKELDALGTESDERQLVGPHAEPSSPRWARAAGWRRKVYENSLLLVMMAIWVASWFGQSVTGWTAYNNTQVEHQEATVSWVGYLGSPDFWEATLQNWQSEFLAVGSFAVFTVYLRQRGSPQSKPVGAAHADTADQG